jgi:CheY-like chemotaxis protein
MTVVDSNREFVALLRDIFAQRFEVVAAAPTSLNGLADSEPDLLFIGLDPKDAATLGGWDLTALARQHKGLARVPIILCTAQNIALDIDGRRLATFSDVHLLTKPFELQVVEQLVDRLLANGSGA